MTPDKLRDVVANYQTRLLSAGLTPKRDEDSTPGMALTDIDWGDIAELDHVLWMCGEVQTFLVEGRYDKANRWLGFIQGVLWVLGIYSIPELQEHNRP